MNIKLNNGKYVKAIRKETITLSDLPVELSKTQFRNYKIRLSSLGYTYESEK